MKYDSEKKLIESIYNVAVDPQNFQKFLDQWEAEFLSSLPSAKNLKNIDIVNKSKQISEAVEDHFFRAYAILDMVEPNENGAISIKQHIESGALAAFIIPKNGKITVVNQSAKQILNLKLGQSLKNIAFQTDDLLKTQKLLDDLHILEPNKVLAIIQTVDSLTSEPIIFALSKLIETDSQQEYLRFCAVHTVWNHEIGKIIQDTFSLTNMELDIAEKLVAGKKLSEIAEEKNRSVLTVRTQSKSLYKKTKLKTQADLVKFFTMLQNFDHQETNINQDPNAKPTKSNILIRENGRKFYYEIHGHPKGQPVLFMHGIMSGTDLPDNLIKCLYNQKIKLFAPHRAGFGMSETSSVEDNIKFFTEDILALLAAEDIQQCKILAHSSGSFYAYHLGSALGERINKIRVISGAVPFASLKQINELNPRQRIATYTAKYTPQLLPFLLRGSELQVRKYGAEGLIDALYADSKFDYEMIKTPEIRNIVVKGFEASFQQGVGSVVTDGRYIFSDQWSHLVKSCTMPIEVFHGADNQAVPLTQVEDFFAQHDNLSVKIIKGGQLILYKYCEKLLKNL